MSSNSTEDLLKYIGKFVESKTFSLPRDPRLKPKTVHYFTEIVRNWNKLNYFIKKSLRSINLNKELNEFENALLLYITYRVQHENATFQSLIDELEGYRKIEIIFENFESIIKKIRSFSWKIALNSKSNIERLSILEAIPSFFIKKLEEVMDISSIEDNLKFMNNFKQREYFTAHLNKVVDFNHKDSDIASLYHIPIQKKSQFIDSDLVKSGVMIILDKGSASVVDILSPNPNEFILDMCAAPGIKTSLISHYTKDESHLIAIDFSKERVKEMKNLTDRMNYYKDFLLNSDSISPPFRSSLKFDKILLDAPCTGSGTFLSHPELKWRQNEKFLHQNMVLQEKLLNSAIDLLKPSGILVYSTCSLYPEEGEYQIKKYLDKLEPMNLPDWLGKSFEIDGSIIPGTARLFPAQHHTQGFFIGKFKKK
jgi:16S rRNA (cytosine967-C5)-methyltransferase